MKKKKSNPFMRLLLILFLIFLGLYISRQTGYYDKQVHDKTVMTAEQIAKFEQDVSEQKEVDIIDYLPEKEDYSNVFTKGANLISKKLATIITYNASNMWDFFKTLFIG